jgi:hypothetical protein
MRTIIAVIIGIALVSTATAAVLQPAGHSKRTPALRLIKGKPLVVQGVRFQVGERVRLTARSGEQTRRGTERAGARGAFVETFAMALDRCSGLLVTAIGNEGSRATLKMPAVYCPPPL